ncbi:efflux RND transporter permease subunit [Thermodesulfatator autotrophicus]|uniref:Acriflavin resistance protein n=1 Tax=Thermodesulfatator autotrophicus TaxID=1795632 RepID=A0A177E757_9BACT|nr:efflux RND transporter permease subunit [Thermodesulfatator autotrophicus]OAG27793.1 acriflavin resistance protein [Thermodesulfatator autotrophicus]
MKKLIAWFAENHVAANLLMLFLLAAGLYSAFNIKVEVFPDITLDAVQISVEYRGAAPEEVEEGIIRPIEERIMGLPGVERIYSQAIEGRAQITVEATKGWDINKLYDDIKVEVDGLTTLPEEAERPIVRRVSRLFPVISIAVYGDVSEKTLKRWAEQIKEELLTLPEVTEVSYFAIRPEEIHVEVSPEVLQKYKLSLGEIAQRIREESVDLPAGRISEKDDEILLRAKGKRYYGEEFLNIPVVTDFQGTSITLGQISQVKDSFRDLVDFFAYFKDKRAVVVQVFRLGDQNVLEISKAVNQYFEALRERIPEGIKVELFEDTSQVLKARLFLLLKNLSLGMVLVLLVLGFFLHPRLAFWIMLGIPISFATALWLLPYFGVSINMVSLFAFILVLGIVVDDAIVVGENVFHLRQKGLPPLEAAIKGTIEVSTPVLFSVLTTMAAFWPLLYGSGVMGKFIFVIPVVVILVLLGSLIESFFVLPAHLAATKGNISPEGVSFLARGLERLVNGPYRRSLAFALRWRYLTLSLSIALLVVVISLWLGGRIKFTFFPRVEGDDVNCYITMPAGTPAQVSLAVAREIEKKGLAVIKEYEKKYGKSLLEYSMIMVGVHQIRHGPRAGTPSVGSHLAQVTLELIPGEERPGISSAEIVREWRKRVGEIPGAEGILFQSELFGLGKPIDIAVSLKDEESLLEVVEIIKKELRNIPGVHDIEDSFLPGKDEIKIVLKPGAEALGLTLEEVARQVRQAFYGAEALRVQRGEDEVQVLVRYTAKERSMVASLEKMRLHLPDGREIPLLEVADLKRGYGYVSLDRLDGRRVIHVLAEVDEKVASASEIREFLATQFLPELKARYPDLVYSFEGEGRRQQESMRDVIKAFLFAQLVIYALLAIPLRSYAQPLIIMFAVPFGIIGAFLGHKLMGYHLNILSFFGIVGLSGVVVNDSLILTDMINRLKTKTRSPMEAVIEGACRRFRPILLTTVTTFAGLTPMILEKSLQARVLIPMAISLGFGVLFATFITLIIVPCAYLVLDDIKKLPRGKSLVGLNQR